MPYDRQHALCTRRAAFDLWPSPARARTEQDCGPRVHGRCCRDDDRIHDRRRDPWFNSNRPSARVSVTVRAGESPDWNTVTRTTGRPLRSTTRPATVRSRRAPSSTIVASVVLPGSTVRAAGGLGRSFVPSVGTTMSASLPAAKAGISKRPWASVLTRASPLVCGRPDARGRVSAMTSNPRRGRVVGLDSTNYPAGRFQRDSLGAAGGCTELAPLNTEPCGFDPNHLDVFGSTFLDLTLAVGVGRGREQVGDRIRRRARRSGRNPARDMHRNRRHPRTGDRLPIRSNHSNGRVHRPCQLQFHRPGHRQS